jgi:hypothetical protein
MNRRTHGGVSNCFCSFALLCAICFSFVPKSEGQQLVQEDLRIQVRQGQNQIHRVGRQSASAVVVAVFDERDRPVPDAAVVFTTSRGGPGGRFPDGDQVMRQTDSSGIARVVGFRANNVAGNFEIMARATFGGKLGTATIFQSNEPQPFVKRKSTLILGSTGIAVIAFVALRSPPPSATITAVTPSGPVGRP